jgi:hypothetical protein
MININWEDLIRPVYCVYVTREDGGKGPFVGVFDTYEDAWEGAKEKGSWGTRGTVETEKGIVIKDEVYVLKFKDHIRLILNEDILAKEQKELDDTLDKLTPEELKRIGVDRDKLKKEKNPIENPLNDL